MSTPALALTLTLGLTLGEGSSEPERHGRDHGGLPVSPRAAM